MVRVFTLLAVLAAAMLQIQCASRILAPGGVSHGAPTIRVLLNESQAAEIELHGRYEVNIRLSERLSRVSKRALRLHLSGRGIVLSSAGGRELGRGNPIAFTAGSANQGFTLKGRPYAGGVIFYAIDGKLRAVNLLDLESYVKGVVPAEMGPRQQMDIEALKAQAVAARTYAFMKMKTGNAKRSFDVRSDVSDQVYRGRAQVSGSTDAAVDATFGQIITYDNVPILSFYHSTCGGRTASASQVFALANSPYLTGVADNFGEGDFCRASPHYRWTASFSSAELSHSFRRLTPSLAGSRRSVESLRIDGRLPSGRVSRISAAVGGRRVVVTSLGVRDLFRSSDAQILRSSLFRISSTGATPAQVAKVDLLGAGSGHGVGMCQWGAIGMARAGYDYTQILRHYYRNTKLKSAY